MSADYTVGSIGDLISGQTTPGNKKVMKKTLKTPGSGQKNAGRNTPNQNAKSPSQGMRKRKSAVLNTPQQNVSPGKVANKQNTPTPKKNGFTPKQKTPPKKNTFSPKIKPITPEADDSESDDEEDDVAMGSDASDDESNDLMGAESGEENDSDDDEGNDDDESEDNDSDNSEDKSPKKRKLDSEAAKRKATNAQKTVKETKEKKSKKADNSDELGKDSDSTIFVGNVSAETKREQLERHFSKFGDIVSVKCRKVSAPVANPKAPKKAEELHSKNSTQNAFIRFATKEEALKALVENGKLLNGTHIRVNMCGMEVKCDANRSIFLGNLSFDSEDEDLWKIFESCGDIESVRIIRNKQTNKAKGFAYVNFVSSDSVESALQMKNVTLNGRELRISAYSANAVRKSNGKVEKKNKNQNNKKGGPGGEKKNFQKKFSPGQNKNKKQNNPKAGGAAENKSPKTAGFQGSKFAKNKKNKFNKGSPKKTKMA